MAIGDLFTAEGDTFADMPARPGHVLFVHVVSKGVQVGAVLGTAFGLGANLCGYTVPVGACAARGAVLGAPLGAAMVLRKAISIDADGITDRGYRIACNQGQNTVDALAFGGMTLGMLVSQSGLRGAALGCAAGVCSYPVAKRAGVTLKLPRPLGN